MLIREVIGRSHGHNWNYMSHSGEPCPFLLHYHPEFELTLTRHSRGTRYIGSDIEGFGELDLVLVGANCAHTWDTAQEAKGVHAQVQVVFFTLDWLQTLEAQGLPELRMVNRWIGTVRQGVIFSQALIARVLPLFDALEATQGLESLSVLLQIVNALPSDGQARHVGAFGALPAGTGNDRRIEAALAYLQQHYRNSVRLEDIAAAAATSNSTLKRVFQDRLAMSVTDVLIQLRIGHASHLLVSTDWPIHRVASESGFANLGHFFRQFSAQKGCTPAQFRRRQLSPLASEARTTPGSVARDERAGVSGAP